MSREHNTSSTVGALVAGVVNPIAQHDVPMVDVATYNDDTTDEMTAVVVVLHFDDDPAGPGMIVHFRGKAMEKLRDALTTDPESMQIIGHGGSSH